ncbi:hypothetical protein [Methanobrevibacter olleyae]|uniref:Uncharacterized protein n=1 Tax=Methanobrevibacter olleyae TaxID=294671 RepID=A0A126QXX0_METOL|nr:hypothetical protein [Methanobrevibacter olleyae]AMK14642.1 hypothetical protein YLM1_0082 [Methanobrevibacter olleyae]SFL26344.1 hypothetical protein SAMN02910297_00370 [Methanobrevibacter olleyae]
MDGIEIVNKFKRETLYEFSEAISILNDEIYLIFKAEIISVDANPSKAKTSKLKRLIKDNENKSETFISYLEIEPIAYLLKTKIKENEYKYDVEAIDNKYMKFIKKNKDKLLKSFLNE